MWNFIKAELEKRLARPQKVSEIPGAERRRTARINMILTIHCSFVGQSEQFQIMTENVNVLGVKSVSVKELRKDSIINLRILLQSQESPILAEGRVVWCVATEKQDKRFYEGGIEFHPLKKDDEIYFQKFIDSHTIGTSEPLTEPTH